MYGVGRKTAPKVRDGKVQSKNCRAVTPHYLNSVQPVLVFDRQKPGAGYRHLVHQAELRQFVTALPEWDVLQCGLDAVVQAEGDADCLGWHRTGVVAVTAWNRGFSLTGCDRSFIADHEGLLQKLRVPCSGSGMTWVLEFNQATARAFQLVHVLVHELGHHHDRMTTRARRRPCRGEGFAEAYALRHEAEVLDLYWQMFPGDY
ncbi:MAG: hypothetical protein JWN70_6610 [Planctomycetaceae bacterium]|nr:hypothetical protein [Planctomycetaceae bacterium]